MILKKEITLAKKNNIFHLEKYIEELTTARYCPRLKKEGKEKHEFKNNLF